MDYNSTMSFSFYSSPLFRKSNGNIIVKSTPHAEPTSKVWCCSKQEGGGEGRGGCKHMMNNGVVGVRRKGIWGIPGQDIANINRANINLANINRAAATHARTMQSKRRAGG
jgi:hypothetical protein